MASSSVGLDFLPQTVALTLSSPVTSLEDIPPIISLPSSEYSDYIPTICPLSPCLPSLSPLSPELFSVIKDLNYIFPYYSSWDFTTNDAGSFPSSLSSSPPRLSIHRGGSTFTDEDEEISINEGASDNISEL